MAGCYGNDPYDKWLEKQQDKYWGCDDPDEDDGEDAAAEAREDRRREEE